MPELFRKALLAPGSHFAPQGVLKLTPSRAERYARKFKSLKREGYRFPIPWGHRLSAMPEPGQREYEMSRFNAGYIEDLEVDKNGQLVIVGQVPPGYSICPQTGDLINPTDGTRIGEVSGAFGNWKDGKGRFHKDILVHAALCTHPVWANQTGFVTAETKTLSTGTESIEYTFFLSSRPGGSEMSKDKDEDDKPGSKKADDALPPMDDSENEEYTPEPDPVPESMTEATPPVETPPPPPATPALPPVTGDLMPKVKTLEQMFGEMGISLMPSESIDGFINSLLNVMTFARGQGMKFDRNEPDETQAAPATANSGAEPPKPEAPPIMMSSLSGPALALAEREQSRMRKDLAKIWDDNKKLGVPVFICDRESAKASTMMLSLTSDAKPKTHQRIREARLVREVMQASKGTAENLETELLKQLSTAPENPAANAQVSKSGVDPDIGSALKMGVHSALGGGRNGQIASRN